MRDEKYNGWANYATWLVNLEYFDGFDPREVYDTRAEAEAGLGAWLRDCIHEDIVQTTVPSFVRTAALAFIADVNWREIANHMIDAHYDTDEEGEA